MKFHQLDQSPPNGSGMNEGDPVSTASDARLPIDESGPIGLQMAQGGGEIGYRIGDVVKTFSPSGQEPTDRGVGLERRQQLNMASPDGNHGFLDALLLHDFSGERLDCEQVPVSLQRRVEIVNGYCDMVDVD